MSKVISWILSMLLAFGFGVNFSEERSTDSEIKQKVQEHVDVIVDESAAIVDDVVDEIRKDENVQKAEQFVDDVKEIVDNTLDDIDAHFGEKDEAEEETESIEQEAEEVTAEQAGEDGTAE